MVKLTDEKEIALDEVLTRFRTYMSMKLTQNLSKGGPEGWRYEKVSYLVERLEEEVKELKTLLLDNPTAYEVIHEAADVANFAMMIADNIGIKETTKP